MGNFGAPRTAFGGAGLRGPKGPFDADKGKDTDSRDRFGFRPRNIDSDAGDRFRDGRNANFRRRDGEQDGEGWSTVKPRKSFGQDGAERFNGRMGGDRLRDGRPHKDDQEKPGIGNRRGFDNYASRDKESIDDDGRPRNGVRGKSDPWSKPDASNDGLTARERIEKAKSWRGRDNRDAEALEDRSGGRTYDRRWGREQRVEREPEWMDEPSGSKSGGHTEEDFKRFMEEMKAREGGAAGKPSAPQATQSPSEAAQPKAPSAPPPVETGPDKFFMAFAPPPGFDGTTPGVAAETKDVLASKPKPAGKASRFTSFFNATQEEKRMKEVQAQPPAQPPMPLNGSPAEPPGGAPPEEEKAAFQQLLLKLQGQTLQASPGPAAPQSFQGPPPASSAGPEPAKAAADTASPEPSHVQRGARPPGNELPADDPRKKMPWAMQDIIAPQPMLPQQTAAARQDQLLQNLVGHRTESGGRVDAGGARNDSNTEFLMNLMRSQPEAPRSEQVMLRMPQPQKSAPIPHVPERDPDFAQGRFPQQAQPQPQHMQQPPQLHQQPQSHPQMPMQQRQMRPHPPGFMDEPAFHGEGEPRLPQPQILQRPPPPPGLDQMGPGPGPGPAPGPNWMPSAPGPPGPQQRIIPPPGLPGGVNRNIPVPNIYPPNFPPQGPGFPSPEIGLPPRNMQPPPGIYGGPPPGFFPPPGGFQGPPPEAFAPFERMPPGVPRGFPRP